MAKMICPEHGKLIRHQTKFGGLWKCEQCDVRCWEGSTSTPCDQKTADARHELHEMFDPLWKEGLYFQRGVFSKPYDRRKVAYQWLATEMGLSRREAHFGMFNLAECIRAKELIEDLLKKKSYVFDSMCVTTLAVDKT